MNDTLQDDMKRILPADSQATKDNALIAAAAEGNLQMVKYLVSIGADVKYEGDTWYGDALTAAAEEGYLEIVKYLLSLGANTHINEALCRAFGKEHTEVTDYLLSQGADVHT